MELSNEQLYDNTVSSVIIIVLGTCGILVNLHVILALRRTKTFGYAFGRICMSHTVANFGNAFVFTCYVAPITLINPEFHKNYLGIRAGQVLILFWNASVFSHFLTALNRWVVMYFPLKVDQIFTKRVIPYFSTECLFDYHIETFTFLFGSSPCSIPWKTNDFKYFRIRRSTLTAINAVCQGVAFMTELVSFFYICLQFENKWIRFCFTTCAWLFVHMVDGLIVVGFNKEIRTFRVFNIFSRSTIHGSSSDG
ncbi:hypothetical protein QR680_007176 [Steinernema hermaphroditum]|uniref:7TM GPCR serpentine receptor class x (Srx) domain-containing protein n=1 Tax=Steinernema hermaphroditum TaxID=289476 RepID=A0AA39HXY2_9BILA|nr:hypothetical protein QR680_007176 [Steinernema hermaphroditum]